MVKKRAVRRDVIYPGKERSSVHSVTLTKDANAGLRRELRKKDPRLGRPLSKQEIFEEGIRLRCNLPLFGLDAWRAVLQACGRLQEALANALKSGR